MSSGSQQALECSVETVVGTTPFPFDRKLIRMTSVSIDGEPTTTPSEEITDTMMPEGDYKTGVTYSGDINGELSVGTFDDFFAAAFHNDWLNDELTLSTVKKAFSIIRAYKDSGGYHIFRGMQVVSMTLTVPEEGIIQVSFTLQGTGRSPVTFTIPDGVIEPVNTNKLLTNVGVGSVLVDGQTLTNEACVTAFSLTIEFSVEAQKCFGLGLSVGKLISTGVNVTGQMTLAWGDEAASLNELKFTDEAVEIFIDMVDETGHGYSVTVPEATLSGALPSGSRTDILQYQVNYTARRRSPIFRRVKPGNANLP